MTPAAKGQRSGEGHAADAVSGESKSEISNTLAAVEPDPLAVKHRDLDPEARYQAVLNDGRREEPLSTTTR